MQATSRPARWPVPAGFALLLLVAGACTSPESRRVRGGGPGADVGNRAPVVEMHEGARPYHDTPCRTGKVKCTGPLPAFGTSRTS